VRRRRSCGVEVPGVVGISVCDFPRVGVRGGMSSGSERAVRLEERGAASEGRIGVEVWRGRGGMLEVVLGSVQVFSDMRLVFMAGVIGRVVSGEDARFVDERRVVLPPASSW